MDPWNAWYSKCKPRSWSTTWLKSAHKKCILMPGVREGYESGVRNWNLEIFKKKFDKSMSNKSILFQVTLCYFVNYHCSAYHLHCTLTCKPTNCCWASSWKTTQHAAGGVKCIFQTSRAVNQACSLTPKVTGLSCACRTQSEWNQTLTDDLQASGLTLGQMQSSGTTPPGGECHQRQQTPTSGFA